MSAPLGEVTSPIRPQIVREVQHRADIAPLTLRAMAKRHRDEADLLERTAAALEACRMAALGGAGPEAVAGLRA